MSGQFQNMLSTMSGEELRGCMVVCSLWLAMSLITSQS